MLCVWKEYWETLDDTEQLQCKYLYKYHMYVHNEYTYAHARLIMTQLLTNT